MNSRLNCFSKNKERETCLLQSAEAFRLSLREWFLREKRDLPWRRERSLYRTVVSEFMLQQTQVDTVIPYFERWVGNWSNFESLAQATEAEVLRAWEGLGYYSRVRNLHALAKKIALEKTEPKSADEWKKFRGIGDYTAAAILSIAQGVPAAVVDGNVVRILARLSGNEETFLDSASAAKSFATLAESLLNKDFPGDHNEAMMELGALVCSRNSPRCSICPVKEFCISKSLGIEETLPRFPVKKTKKREILRLYHCVDGKVLLTCNTAGTRRLKNLYEFPNIEDFSNLDLKLNECSPIFSAKRGITNEIITEKFFEIPPSWTEKLEQNFIGKEKQLKKISIEKLEEITFSGPHRKWWKEKLSKKLLPKNSDFSENGGNS